MLRGDLPGGVHFAFSERHGGVSSRPYDELNLGAAVGDSAEAVRENRRRFVQMAGAPAGSAVFMTQVHGSHVAVVDGPRPEQVPDTDALVTGAADVALAVLVADCVPVLLADGRAGVVGAVHSGRRGVHAGVVPRTLEAMVGLGARLGDIAARLGPAVCGACYEVPADMQAEVLAVAPQARATTPSGTPGLDLREGLVGVLRAQGVRDVALVGGCTREDPSLYSYRRDSTTGRFAGIVWRTGEPAADRELVR